MKGRERSPGGVRDRKMRGRERSPGGVRKGKIEGREKERKRGKTDGRIEINGRKY